MAEIAVELGRALAHRAACGGPAAEVARIIGQGDDWSVADLVCTAGPHDKPFEENHSYYSIALVSVGTFQYVSTVGREMLTPGSLLLVNAHETFRCGHEHGAGDRCTAFTFTQSYFERIAADAGLRGASLNFSRVRIPPLREIAPIFAMAHAGAAGTRNVCWEELGIQLASKALELLDRAPGNRELAPPSALARVTRVVRLIDRTSSAPHTLQSLAKEARLSPYHFLRSFQQLTGVTPHQYLLRARLRDAAGRLTRTGERVLDIALDCGFGDVSNFHRLFRAEFGLSPRAFRAQHARRPWNSFNLQRPA